VALCAGVQGTSNANPFTVVGFMLLLAGLDFVGTMLAKEWTVHRSAWQLVAGGAAFLALFVVLVCGLRYAEMSLLTLGWIVVLQTAVLAVDRSRYGTHLSIGGWLAVLTILVLQGYLLLGGAQTAPVEQDSGQPSAASAAS
jgi:hypothetical protein